MCSPDLCRIPEPHVHEGFAVRYIETVEPAIKPPVLDPFDKVVAEVLALNRRKRADYTDNKDPWANFRDSSRQVSARPGTSVEVLIATKQSRLRQLLQKGREANNESVRDTLLDRAVYSLISLAMYDEGLYAD
jgi:hypothetical protein